MAPALRCSIWGADLACPIELWNRLIKLSSNVSTRSWSMKSFPNKCQQISMNLFWMPPKHGDFHTGIGPPTMKFHFLLRMNTSRYTLQVELEPLITLCIGTTSLKGRLLGRWDLHQIRPMSSLPLMDFLQVFRSAKFDILLTSWTVGTSGCYWKMRQGFQWESYSLSSRHRRQRSSGRKY